MTTQPLPLDADVRASIRELGYKRIRDLATQVDRSQEFSRELWDLICEIGLPSMPFPDAESGYTGSYRAYVEGVEEVATHGACAALYSGPTVQVATVIDRFGTEEQKQRWGKPLISGGALGAWSFTEPQTGSDPKQIQTKAVREDDGWRIVGSKMFTSFAPYADVALVFARTSDTPLRLGAFLVDTSNEGWQPGPPINMLSFGGQGTAPVTIDVKVGPEALLGDVDAGFDIMVGTESEAKVRASAIALGIGARALQEAAQYALDREHRGEPIGHKFPTIQGILGEMAAQVDSARAVVYSAAEAVDRGDEKLKVIAASTRIICARMAREVTNLAMQVCGAYGFTHDMVLERLYREGKFYEVGQGVIELQKMIVGRHVLERQKNRQRG